MPFRILATFACGWNGSASAKRHRSRPAIRAPTVVLPLPAGPAAIRITAVTIRVHVTLIPLGPVVTRPVRRRSCRRWHRETWVVLLASGAGNQLEKTRGFTTLG